MKRRRIRGSKGPIVILLVAVVLCAGAAFLGKFIQDNFMGVVKSELGLKDQRAPLPPNPASKSPQM